MAKYLDKNGLLYFWGKIKALVPTKTSQIINDSGFVTVSTIENYLNRSTKVNASDAAYSTAMVRGIYAGTTDMTAGTTPLTNGVIYLVYE